MLSEPGGDAAYLNRLATACLRYQRQRLWWLVGTGVSAGLAVALGAAALWVLAAILLTVGYRDEAFGRVMQGGKLLVRAWRDAGEGRTCFGLIEQPARDM